jgi:hypothetical protein
VELETIIWGNYMAEFTIYTHSQRPELESFLSTFGDVWPEFIFHDEIARTYFHHTDTTFAHLNLYLCDENDVLIAAGYGVPIAWDGSIETFHTTFVPTTSNMCPSSFCSILSAHCFTK